MTERLKHLLDGEAQDLSIPPPPTDAVLRKGRDIRRRSRLVVGASGVAAAVVVSGTVIALAGDGANQAAPDPASTVGSNAVFSYGNHVFYAGPDNEAVIDDDAVKSLFYTSAGVLVRHGDNANSDGGGPQRFSLVTTPDGDVRRLGLVNEATVHASDPDQPYVAYGEAVGGELQVVVYDVEADAEKARVTVRPTAETWFPVSLDGDMVYIQDRAEDETYAVDWKAGTAEPSDVASPWEVAGGHAGTETDGKPTVVDVADGDVLVTADGPGYFDLSPDGRYAQLVDEEGGALAFAVYDVATGEPITLEGNPFDWGWTADGDMFKVERNQVTTCDSATDECTVESYSQPPIPEPAPVTHTMSDPVCPDGEEFSCYDDELFLANCNKNPDECEWIETRSIEDLSIQIKLGGRAYES